MLHLFWLLHTLLILLLLKQLLLLLFVHLLNFAYNWIVRHAKALSWLCAKLDDSLEMMEDVKFEPIYRRFLPKINKKYVANSKCSYHSQTLKELTRILMPLPSQMSPSRIIFCTSRSTGISGIRRSKSCNALNSVESLTIGKRGSRCWSWHSEVRNSKRHAERIRNKSFVDLTGKKRDLGTHTAKARPGKFRIAPPMDCSSWITSRPEGRRWRRTPRSYDFSIKDLFIRQNLHLHRG